MGIEDLAGLTAIVVALLLGSVAVAVHFLFGGNQDG